MSTITVATPASKRTPQRIGTRLEYNGTLTMTASYATGGDTLNAKLLGISKFHGAIIASAGGIVFEFIPDTDPATAKVKAYRQKDPGAAGGADIALTEVAAAVDLSALKPYAIIHGR